MAFPFHSRSSPALCVASPNGRSPTRRSLSPLSVFSGSARFSSRRSEPRPSLPPQKHSRSAEAEAGIALLSEGVAVKRLDPHGASVPAQLRLTDDARGLTWSGGRRSFSSSASERRAVPFGEVCDVATPQSFSLSLRLAPSAGEAAGVLLFAFDASSRQQFVQIGAAVRALVEESRDSAAARSEAKERAREQVERATAGFEAARVMVEAAVEAAVESVVAEAAAVAAVRQVIAAALAARQADGEACGGVLDDAAAPTAPAAGLAPLSVDEVKPARVPSYGRGNHLASPRGVIEFEGAKSPLHAEPRRCAPTGHFAVVCSFLEDLFHLRPRAKPMEIDRSPSIPPPELARGASQAALGQRVRRAFDFMEMSGKVMATSFGTSHLELSRKQVAKACREDGEVRQLMGFCSEEDEKFDEVIKQLEQTADVCDGISPDGFVLMYLRAQENAAATQVQALLRGKATRRSYRSLPGPTRAGLQRSISW